MLATELTRVFIAMVLVVIPPAVFAGELRARYKHGKPFSRWFFLAAGLTVLQLACGAWGILWEADWVEETRHSIVIPGLGPDFRFRLVHLSDLHVEPLNGCRHRLAEAQRIASEARPELIVITGDFLNHPSGLDLAASFVADLVAIAPVIGIRGNWDRPPREPKGFVEAAGGTFLEDQTRLIRQGPHTVGVVGLNYWNPEAMAPLLQEVAGAQVRIVLTHTPDNMELARDLGAHLYLGGHTHGGQIRLPWYGALVTLTRTGKRFEAGWYKLGNLVGYTSRGLGMEGGIAPRIRFLCRPEVTIFDLRGGGAVLAN